jgi:phage terminase Nu1 subunit (DNA packaging protein)
MIERSNVVALRGDSYLTREELAAVLKVHPRTVDRWRRDGMPSELWGPRRGTRRFPLAACMAWAKAEGSP